MKPLDITARRGQARDLILKDGGVVKMTLVSSTSTQAVIRLDPGDAVVRVLLDETASPVESAE